MLITAKLPLRKIVIAGKVVLERQKIVHVVYGALPSAINFNNRFKYGS